MNTGRTIWNVTKTLLRGCLIDLPAFILGLAIFIIIFPFTYYKWRVYKKMVTKKMKNLGMAYGFDAAIEYRKRFPRTYWQFMKEAQRHSFNG